MSKENMGESTPPEVGQQAALDAALDSSGQINKSPLPANGRPIGKATKLIGLGVAAAAVVSGCLPSWLVRINSNPSPMSSDKVEPSNLPTPTVTLAETPSVVPSTSPSVGPSQTSEVTPSPEKTLEQEVQDYLDGTTPLPDELHSFHIFNPNYALAPFNILEDNIPFKSNIGVSVQVYLIGEQIAYDNANTAYLKAAYGIQDVAGNRLAFIGDVGKLDSGWEDYIILNQGPIATQPGPNVKQVTINMTDMQNELQKYNGKSMIAVLLHVPDLSKDTADTPEVKKLILEQNAVAKDLMIFLEQTLKKPYTEVSMSSSLKAIISVKGHISDNLTNETIDPSSTPYTNQFVPFGA
jgi:hypothetical protein